jgi:hypothetical protein
MSNSDAQCRIDRARAYLDKLPPAISGQGGHKAAFLAAVAMAHGFALSEAEAVDILRTVYNPKCQPEWSEEELLHKVRDAISGRHKKPRGHLFDRAQNANRPSGGRDWNAKAKECAASWSMNGVRIAEQLGLPVAAIQRVAMLGSADWGRIGGVVTWPEHDGDGEVIGIAYRTEAGEKKAMKGSKRGIILSTDWKTVRPGLPLIIAEGMSDLASVAHAGFAAIARPSKALKPANAAKMLAGLLGTTEHTEILLLADVDDAGERSNAVAIASLLVKRFPERNVRWAVPPDGAKDGRAWFVARPHSEEWSDRGRAFLAALEPREPPADPPPSSKLPAALGNRRQVEITTEEHRVNSAVVEQLARDTSVYQRNGELVRVMVQRPDVDGPRLSVIPRIEVIPTPALRDIISRWVEFYKIDRTEGDEEFIAKHPPAWCVNAVSARGGWAGVRHLVGVVPFPVLRRDGSLLTTPGYDPSSGLFLHWDGKPLSVSDQPTQADARLAALELLDAVSDFPFQADMHKSAWLAGLLTPLARAAFDGPAPLFLVDANVRAAGKGMLLEVVSRIVTGNPFPVVSYPAGSKDGEEELRKKITTILMYGDRIVLFDNLTGAFGDGTLDRCLTSTEWQDRQLGSNRQFRSPVDTIFFASGNNVAIRADTARRVCHVRLESPEERPEERSDFKRRTLISWVLDNRERLLTGALTILRAYHTARRPDQDLKPWGSFESWSRLVRNAVVWCGLPDPGETRQVIQEQADETALGLRLLIAALELVDSDRNGLTAGEIVGAAYDQNSPHPKETVSMLVAALEALIGKSDGRRLGYRLRGLRRRVVDGKFLDVRGRGERDANRWVVVPASEFRRDRETCPPSPPCPPPPGGHGAHGGHDSPRVERNGVLVNGEPGRPGELFREPGRLPD